MRHGEKNARALNLKSYLVSKIELRACVNAREL